MSMSQRHHQNDTSLTLTCSNKMSSAFILASAVPLPQHTRAHTHTVSVVHIDPHAEYAHTKRKFGNCLLNRASVYLADVL